MIPSAMACLALHAFGCLGLLMLLGKLRDASQERAWSLVALPADAYGAPGSLTKTCANGHVFAETWRECPHCAEAETA